MFFSDFVIGGICIFDKKIVKDKRLTKTVEIDTAHKISRSPLISIFLFFLFLFAQITSWQVPMFYNSNNLFPLLMNPSLSPKKVSFSCLFTFYSLTKLVVKILQHISEVCCKISREEYENMGKFLEGKKLYHALTTVRIPSSMLYSLKQKILTQNNLIIFVCAGIRNKYAFMGKEISFVDYRVTEPLHWTCD